MEARGRTGLRVVVYTGKKESLDEDKGQPRSNRYRTYFNRIKRAIEIGDEETLQRTKEAIMYAPAKELKNSEASELMDMIKNRKINEPHNKEVSEGIDGWDNRTGVIKRIDKYLYDNPEAIPPKGYIQPGSRAYDDAVSQYGDYVTTPFGSISTDDLMQYARDNNLLNEASYGGVFDIEDDQYFTKEELVEFADEIIEKLDNHYEDIDPSFLLTALYMDNDTNVLHIEIDDDDIGTFAVDQKIDYRKVKTPYQIRNYTKEILDKFIKQIDSLKEALSPADYSPKQTGIAYKVFKVKNGKLYPPMVSNKNNEPTPVGVWLDAEEGEFAGLSKTGRPQVKSIGSGNLSYRPGWHLGDIPRAKQFDRRNKETGEMEFPKDFVWAECEYAMDVDYQPESDARGYERTHIDDKGNVITTKSDKYQHSLAGLPKLPKDGYYKYRTNPNPDTVPWIITGQMKVNKLLSDDEVNEILKSKGVEPIHRQGGDKTLKELGL